MPEQADCGKIIVLTGAGASAALGMPTMADFPKLIASAGGELKTLTDGMRWEEKKEDLEYIYERLELYIEAGQRCAEDGDMNLLQAFGTAESAATLRSRATEALSQLRELILEKLGEVTRAPNAAVSDYSRVVHKLRKLNGSPLRVFTTNYDLTFESLTGLSREGALVNGLRPMAEEFRWSRAAYAAAAKDAARVVVYRLHGCSHWFADEHAGEYDKIVCLRALPKPGKGLRPVVIFPARPKAGGVHANPFSFAYGELRKAMTAAKLCVVIGYSFRDAGVTEALLSAHRGMRFVIVDPKESEEVLPRLDQWLTIHVQGEFGKEKVNHCLLSTCEHVLRSDPDGQSETRVPGGTCTQCDARMRCPDAPI